MDRRFALIIATIALDAMGIGLALPVMPDLLQSLQGADIGDAAAIGGWLSFTYAVMQFLAGPLLGNLSDAYGRRPVLIVSLVAMAGAYVLTALAPTLWLIFLARAMAGVTGATFATGAAYLADVSTKETRSANFGLVGAAFGIGFVLGPALGGLLGELGPRAPFWAAAVLAGLNAVAMAAVLPESLRAPRAFDIRRINPFVALWRLRRLPQVGGLMLAHGLYQISNTVYPAVWSFFIIARFGWSPAGVGASLAAFGVASAAVQAGAIRVILKRFGERQTAQAGLAIAALGLVALSAVDRGWLLFALMPVSALALIAGPALTGMMANRTADDAQGDLQGAIAAVGGIAVIVSPPLMTGTFKLFTEAPRDWPGAPFALAALVALAAGVVLARTRLTAPAA